MLISITQLRNTALTSSSPPMAWTKLRRVLISMSARFSILEISACLTLRFLASVFLSEGKSLVQFRQGHVLPQLLLARPGVRTRPQAAAPSRSCCGASRSGATSRAGPGMCGPPGRATRREVLPRGPALPIYPRYSPFSKYLPVMCSLLVMAQAQKARRAVPVSMY